MVANRDVPLPPAARPRTAGFRPRAAERGTVHDRDVTTVVRSDAELLRACAQGDDVAWRLLVGRYERLVFSVALRNGVGRDEAADITQRAFIELLDGIDHIRSADGLASWLMTVARRLAWKERRRSERERALPEPEPVVEDPIAIWERAAVVQAGLHSMRASCRELLLALYFGPGTASYSEVAAELGRPIGAIGPMRARCLEQLRKIIGEDVPA